MVKQRNKYICTVKVVKTDKIQIEAEVLNKICF